MSENEKKLLKHFISEATTQMGNNGCNDVSDEVYAGWTLDERKKFVKEYHEWNGDIEEYDENFLYLPDFAILSFLSSKL